MHVDPVKPMLKPPGIKHLKPKCDILLSTFAFKFNLRRNILAPLQKILRWAMFLNMWSLCIHMLHPAVNLVHRVSRHTLIAYIVRIAGGAAA